MILMDDSLILYMEDMTQEVNLQSYLNKNIFWKLLAWAYLVSQHVYVQHVRI